jgi:hypothetical protein
MRQTRCAASPNPPAQTHTHLQTVSTSSSVPVRLQTSPTPARLWCTPVEDSPCNWLIVERGGAAGWRRPPHTLLPLTASRSTAPTPPPNTARTARAPHLAQEQHRRLVRLQRLGQLGQGEGLAGLGLELDHVAAVAGGEVGDARAPDALGVGGVGG